MTLNLIKKVNIFSNHILRWKQSLRFSSLHEPDYLQVGKSEIPLYPSLNIKITGYVYPVLESYQSYIHKILEIMNLENDSWPMPPQELKIQRFKPQSTVIATEYYLNIYERNVQIPEITGTQCPILIRVLEAALPESVSLNVEFYNPDTEKRRFVPDKGLLDLKSELQSFESRK